jgi:hypothetical protein
VKLAYPPGHPQDAFIIGLVGVWFLPVFVGGLGAIIALVGLILLFATSVPKATATPAAPTLKLRKAGR